MKWKNFYKAGIQASTTLQWPILFDMKLIFFFYKSVCQCNIYSIRSRLSISILRSEINKENTTESASPRPMMVTLNGVL